MRLVLFILIISMTTSCSPDDRVEKEKFIKDIVESDWKQGIPFDGLLDSIKLCHKHSDYIGCEEIDLQLADISTSLKSCKVDQRSQLCKMTVVVINKHPISNVLPDTREVVGLPSNPFYWDMPTNLLDAQADHFNYRAETFDWWWKKWRLTIINAILILIIFVSTLIVWKIIALNKQEELEKKSKKTAEAAEQKKIKIQIEEQEKQRKLQAEEEAQKANIARMRLINDKYKAEKKIAEKLQKIAAEKKRLKFY